MFEALNCDLRQYFNDRPSINISQDESSAGNVRASIVTAPLLDTSRPMTREHPKRGDGRRKMQFVRDSIIAETRRPSTQIKSQGRARQIRHIGTVVNNELDSVMDYANTLPSNPKQSIIRSSLATASTHDPSAAVQKSIEASIQVVRRKERSNLTPKNG